MFTLHSKFLNFFMPCIGTTSVVNISFVFLESSRASPATLTSFRSWLTCHFFQEAFRMSLPPSPPTHILTLSPPNYLCSPIQCFICVHDWPTSLTFPRTETILLISVTLSAWLRDGKLMERHKPWQIKWLISTCELEFTLQHINTQTHAGTHPYKQMWTHTWKHTHTLLIASINFYILGSLRSPTV